MMNKIELLTELAAKEYKDKFLNKPVFTHSLPKNSEFYDSFWNYQLSAEHNREWGQQRLIKLKNFIGVNKLHKEASHTLLDMCCGLGRFSIAALELGFENVVACDGSSVGPKFINDMVVNQNIPEDSSSTYSKIHTNLPIKNTFSDRIFPVQLDIEKMNECFRPKSFGAIIHHMALHHTRDYKKTLYDLSQLLVPNGILVFNFFTKKTTPQVTYDLREIFLNEDMKLVRQFLIDNGKREINSLNNVKNLSDFDRFLKSKTESKYLSYRQKLKELTTKYDTKTIYERLTWEDMQTPYLHNLDSNEVIKYVVDDLNLKILNYNYDRICAFKQ